jgi:hypothetical protein
MPAKAGIQSLRPIDSITGACDYWATRFPRVVTSGDSGHSFAISQQGLEFGRVRSAF